MKRILFLMFCVLPVLHACAGKGETPLSDPPFDEICTLSQEEEPLGAINSIDYVSDSAFVLCTESQIYLYDFSGSLIRKIGRMGHPEAEICITQLQHIKNCLRHIVREILRICSGICDKLALIQCLCIVESLLRRVAVCLVRFTLKRS